MPGGTQEAYKYIEEIVKKVAAQVDDGPCVTYIGEGGAGNFVKMVHNGIEYGDMQLISEAYDVLKTVGGLTNPELEQAFNAWNKVCLAKTLPGCKRCGIVACCCKSCRGFVLHGVSRFSTATNLCGQ